MNDTVQDWINGFAGHTAILDTLMKITAQDAIYMVPLLLVVIWFWPAGAGRAANQRLAIATFFAVLVSLGFAAVLASLHQEARPFVTDLSTKLLISHSADNAFPSDHATVAFAAGAAILAGRRFLGLVCLSVATMIAVARIYVGVHWPSDVVAAAVLGLFTGFILARFAPMFEGPQRLLSRFLPPLLISEP